MDYSVDKTTLYALIDEEVSKVADEAYSDNGVSLYDSVVLTEKDSGMVYRLIDEAVDGLASRLYDVCKFSTDTHGNSQLVFYLPDFDDTMENAARSEITHFIVYSVCTEIFKSRRAQSVPDYEARAAASIGKAVSLLKSRKSPVDVW